MSVYHATMTSTNPAASPERSAGLSLTEPWLIAVWPGMGQVALGAGSYLLEKLGGTPLQTIVNREYFDVSAVAVEGGVVRSPGIPKSTLYASPAAGRRSGPDLLIFIGEAQPSHKNWEFCHELLDLALARGVRRVVTFAAMATPVHPAAAPRVFGVASESSLLPLLAKQEISLLAEGQISGLNGVLLAAAAERGIEAICLLGELPFFAVQVPNPKASLAVLRAFMRISGTEIDLSEIEAQARAVERALTEVIERASKQAEAQQEREHREEAEPEFGAPAPEAEEEEEKPRSPPPAALARIEELFRRARTDKEQAIRLKAELDKLGLFKEYEDRFLDLFKKDGPH